MCAILTSTSAQQLLGKRVREERERCEMTLLELAGALDVDESTISRWETGDRAIDSVNLRLISIALGVPMEVFFRPSIELITHARQGHADNGAMNDMVGWARSFLTDVEFVQREAQRRRD